MVGAARGTVAAAAGREESTAAGEEVAGGAEAGCRALAGLAAAVEAIRAAIREATRVATKEATRVAIRAEGADLSELATDETTLTSRATCLHRRYNLVELRLCFVC